jgi:hypothetical protein
MRRESLRASAVCALVAVLFVFGATGLGSAAFADNPPNDAKMKACMDKTKTPEATKARDLGCDKAVDKACANSNSFTLKACQLSTRKSCEASANKSAEAACKKAS